MLARTNRRPTIVPPKDVKGHIKRLLRRVFAFPFSVIHYNIIAPLKTAEAKLRRGDLSQGLKIKKTPFWERTYDVQGHKPKEPLTCKFCGTPMFLRHSVLYLYGNNDNEANATNINQMSYKCPRCAWFNRFMVTDNVKYLELVYRYRHGEFKFIPSADDWGEVSPQILQQLEALGYVGGRDGLTVDEPLPKGI